MITSNAFEFGFPNVKLLVEERRVRESAIFNTIIIIFLPI